MNQHLLCMELFSHPNYDDVECLEHQLNFGDEAINFERSSRNKMSSVHWLANLGPEEYFEEVWDDFGSEDYAMTVLKDSYGKTLDQEHLGPLETTVGELTNIEDFYDRAAFIVLDGGNYEATWENYPDKEDNRVCFLLKSDESVVDSKLEHLMDKTLEGSDRFYDEIKDLHRADFEDLRRRAQYTP